jgi:hypothetical protein
MINTKNENQGSIKKAQILLKNDLGSLKADLRFARAQLILKKEKVKDHEEIKKIKLEIKHLKTNYQAYKVKKKQEIILAKELYQETLKALKETDHLTRLKFELEDKNKIAKLQYQKTLTLIDNNKILIKNKIDDQQSNQE